MSEQKQFQETRRAQPVAAHAWFNKEQNSRSEIMYKNLIPTFGKILFKLAGIFVGFVL